ncbi:LIM and SH3 domain protein 1-like [Diadema antillarum]|uniref:LIM and SH3 domain protein 1-like n=1 Tax=Diadema antillarum TaxID=105358 RepID=UPI003A89DE05
MCFQRLCNNAYKKKVLLSVSMATLDQSPSVCPFSVLLFTITAYSGNQPRQAVGSLFDPQMQRQPAPPPQQAPPQNYGGGRQQKYRAMYDYNAADSDEVSFKEGDLVVNWQHIDEGWMTGTVERTGQTGMLPSNYVELV